MAAGDEHGSSDADSSQEPSADTPSVDASCRGRLRHDDLPRGPRAIEVGEAVTALTYALDGSLLATGDARGEICLRDPASGQARRRLAGHTGAITALDFTLAGSVLVSAGADGGLRVWDATGGQLRYQIEATPGPTRRWQPPAAYVPAAITALAATQDGSLIATGRWDGRVQLWDTVTGRHLRDFAVQPYEVTSLAFTHDGTLLAVANEAELELHLYDVATGVDVFGSAGFMEPPLGAWFSRDGSRLMAVDRKALMLRFDRQAPGRYYFGAPRPLGMTGSARAMDVSGDTLLLAFGDGAATRIFAGDVADDTAGTRLCFLDHGHEHDVLAVAISPDRGQAASGDRGGRLVLWSLADADCSSSAAGGAPGTKP